jgi:hypothetical protein
MTDESIADPMSRVERVNHRAKETSTVLMEADNLSVRRGAAGELILELFRFDARKRTHAEAYKFVLCQEDAERVRREMKGT